MIPVATKPRTARWYTGISIAIFFGVAAVIAIAGLMGNLIHHTAITLQIAASLLGVSFYIVVALCFVIMFRRLSRQKLTMSRFAEVNGWRYEGRYNGPKDPAISPPSGMSLERTVQRFKIEGSFNGTPFLLIQLIGWPGKDSGKWAAPGKAIIYLTILRLEGRVHLREGKQVNIESEYSADYTYITFFGNAVSRENLMRMFDFITS